MAASLARHRGVFLIAFSLVLVAWGATGLYQGLHSGFSGGLYDPEYRVPGVPSGSLADKSGFQAGDRVISVEGMPVERLGMESRWPRAFATRIGQSRRFVVERNGVQVPLDVVYPAPFPSAVNNRIGAGLVGNRRSACQAPPAASMPGTHPGRRRAKWLSVQPPILALHTAGGSAA